MFRSLFIISLIVFAKSETEKTFSTKDEQIIRKSQMVLNERNFDKVVGKGHTFVKFYAPWCGHCQMMEEDWKDVGKFVENNQQLFKGKDLIVAEIDCVANSMTCLKEGVDAYPTIKLFEPRHKHKEYIFARSAERMKRFLVDTFTDIENLPEDSIGLITLNDFTFEKFKDKTKFLVVKFHIPGCHHCKTFKETYDDLIINLSFDPDAENIKFAEVNCMDMDSLEVCSEEGVDGFPAIHLYKDGDIEDVFSGERTMERLEKFIWDVVEPSRTEDEFDPFEMFAKMSGEHGGMADEEEEFEECDCSEPDCDCSDSEDYDDEDEEDEEEDEDYDDADEETEDEFIVVNDEAMLNQLLNEDSKEKDDTNKELKTEEGVSENTESKTKEEKSEEDTLGSKESSTKDEL